MPQQGGFFLAAVVFPDDLTGLFHTVAAQGGHFLAESPGADDVQQGEDALVPGVALTRSYSSTPTGTKSRPRAQAAARTARPVWARPESTAAATFMCVYSSSS